MKKLFISAILSLFVVSMFQFLSFANVGIVEGTGVKVVIDGSLYTFKDIPIIINGRTLLPLRETLTGLGIQNDDEHIKWNADEKSVTVYKDSTVIILKVNSNTALVNDGVQTLDVVPVNYKNRVYIPARFVSQSLGRKILWDGTSSTVFINDESKLGDMKALLQSSDYAMKSINKAKFTINMNLGMQFDKSKANFNTDSSGSVDMTKKLMYAHIETSAMDNKAENDYLFSDKDTYVKDKTTNTWKKQDITETGIEDVFNSDMSSDEILCAGLLVQKSESTEEMILKGNTYPVEIFKKALGNYKNIKNFWFKNCYSEIVIDEKTNLVKSMKVKVNGSVQMEKIEPQMDITMNINYTDYNGDFEIDIPELP